MVLSLQALERVQRTRQISPIAASKVSAAPMREGEVGILVALHDRAKQLCCCLGAAAVFQLEWDSRRCLLS